MKNTVKVGDSVILKTPENPVFDKQPATVEGIEGWGCHVSTIAGSGRFRAAWHEMEMVTPEGVHHGIDMTKSQAKDMGYTGDECPVCGSVRLKWNGSCKLCEDCNQSTGCT